MSNGRNWAMRPWSTSSRAASSRSQSTMRRCTSGKGSRLRSGRGGKRPALPAAPACPLSLSPLRPHQEALPQHHRPSGPVEPLPQPTLVLVPAQQPLGLLVVLLHPVPPVSILHQLVQGRLRTEVAPVVLALAGRAQRLLADQPARLAPAVGQHP